MKEIALVTGANRGLGLGTVKALLAQGYEVILTSRDETEGARLAKENGAVFHALDVANPESISKLERFVAQEFGRLGVLINNAGVLPDAGIDAFHVTLESLTKTLQINTIGPFAMCQKFIPLMIKQNHGRVVNVSTGMGQLSEMSGGYPAYRMSKTALNAVTRIFAAETGGRDILVNSVCPGWVKTDMGGPNAARDLAQGVSGIVWAATLPQGGPTGGFFRDGKPLDW